jgi:DNA-binding NtrC family response regulator
MNIENQNINDEEKKELLKRTKLLLVDDEVAYTKSLDIIFKKKLTTLIAQSLEEAKNNLELYGNEIGCVITDIELSPDNPQGLELITFIKENYPEINVIANSSEQKYVDEAIKLGANAGFKKPIDLVEVIKTVMPIFESDKKS